MPQNNEVLIFKKKNQTNHKLISPSDLIFCLDFSSLNRINELGEMVRQSSAKKVLIDHHLEPEKFADWEQWDGTAASTAELVYELIDQLGDKNLIDSGMADCLYAGLMTDTGSFRHSNTNIRFLRSLPSL